MDLTATNAHGMRAKWFARGATLAELHVSDADGNLADVVLGFDSESGYASADNQYFGCTTGRYANRIGAGRFTLDGVEHRLAVNNGPNHLHGGTERDLSRVTWDAEPLGAGVRFRYTSPDGEEGYPGTLSAVVSYTLTNAGGLRIDYEATTDRPTVLNLTNHSYFNLSGHGAPTALDHVVQIHADSYTPSDENSLPTGEVAPVEGTPLDLREARPLRDGIEELKETPQQGYDHNYVLNGPAGTLRECAVVRDPASGRIMRVLTDQPGVQLYTGNFLSGATCKGGAVYPGYSALCLEAQHFPDSPNKPHFPSTVLRPGETYRQTTVYAFSAE